LLVQVQAVWLGTTERAASGWPAALGVAILSGLEVGVAWWSYFRLAHGLRRLVDPRSATLFLILVPGGIMALFAIGHALLAWETTVADSLWHLTGDIWLSRSLGILALAPPCLVLGTWWMVRHGLALAEPVGEDGDCDTVLPLDWGGRIEIGGLALGAIVLGMMMGTMHLHGEGSYSSLPMLPLFLIIWASLRQGVRGGTVVAGAAALPPLLV